MAYLIPEAPDDILVETGEWYDFSERMGNFRSREPGKQRSFFISCCGWNWISPPGDNITIGLKRCPQKNNSETRRRRPTKGVLNARGSLNPFPASGPRRRRSISARSIKWSRMRLRSTYDSEHSETSDRETEEIFTTRRVYS